MFRIRKRFDFSSSHSLNLPADHPCSRNHGHNYRVELVLAADALDEDGMVFDYRRLDPFKAYIKDEVDHRNLNDLFPCTTAERLAAHFHDAASKLLALAGLPNGARLEAVRVSETPNTWAEYKP